jgi:hypothetical protein
MNKHVSCMTLDGERGLKGTYDRVVGTAFSAKVHGMIFVDAFIDNPIREHGLRCNAEYKDTERQVVSWLGVLPHIYYSQ